MKHFYSWLTRIIPKMESGNRYVSGWGEGSHGSPHVVSYDKKSRVLVGKYVSFSKEVNLLLGMKHGENVASGYPVNRNITDESDRGDITIGNDVSVGSGATIIGPLIIADGVIIEDNAVVVDDIPAYAIAGGSPAKVIGYRYNHDQVEKLLDIMWWNWGKTFIEAHQSEIENSDIDSFIAKYS